jgi:hypothetical protein
MHSKPGAHQARFMRHPPSCRPQRMRHIPMHAQRRAAPPGHAADGDFPEKTREKRTSNPSARKAHPGAPTRQRRTHGTDMLKPLCRVNDGHKARLGLRTQALSRAGAVCVQQSSIASQSQHDGIVRRPVARASRPQNFFENFFDFLLAIGLGAALLKGSATVRATFRERKRTSQHVRDTSWHGSSAKQEEYTLAGVRVLR